MEDSIGPNKKNTEQVFKLNSKLFCAEWAAKALFTDAFVWISGWWSWWLKLEAKRAGELIGVYAYATRDHVVAKRPGKGRFTIYSASGKSFTNPLHLLPL